MRATASSPAAIGPSTRCGSRRATGCGACDITPEDNPYEAGLGFAVRLDKTDDFVGRDALAAVKASGAGPPAALPRARRPPRGHPRLRAGAGRR